MTARSLATGRFTSGVLDRWFLPRIFRAVPPLVWMTGGDGTAAYGAGEAQHVIDALVGEGYRVVQPSVPYLLGNPTSVSRIVDAVAFARTHLGCTADPPILVGQSNGGICALNYARQHTTAGVVGLICPVDLNAIYTGNLLGLRGELETAWSVTHPTPLPAGASPAANTGELSCPIQLHEASNDPLAVGVAGFATATGAEVIDVGALGHTAAAVEAVDADAVVEFVTAL